MQLSSRLACCHTLKEVSFNRPCMAVGGECEATDKDRCGSGGIWQWTALLHQCIAGDRVKGLEQVLSPF